jgi:hypothetical protein
MSYSDTSPRQVRTISEFEGPGLSLRSVGSSGLEIDVRVKARAFRRLSLKTV